MSDDAGPKDKVNTRAFDENNKDTAIFPDMRSNNQLRLVMIN